MNHVITFALFAGGFYLLLVGLDRVLRPIRVIRKLDLLEVSVQSMPAYQSITEKEWNNLIKRIESEVPINASSCGTCIPYHPAMAISGVATCKPGAGILTGNPQLDIRPQWVMR